MKVEELEKLVNEGKKVVVAAVTDMEDVAMYVSGNGEDVITLAGGLIAEIAASSPRPMTTITAIMETTIEIMKMKLKDEAPEDDAE